MVKEKGDKGYGRGRGGRKEVRRGIEISGPCSWPHAH